MARLSETRFFEPFDLYNLSFVFYDKKNKKLFKSEVSLRLRKKDIIALIKSKKAHYFKVFYLGVLFDRKFLNEKHKYFDGKIYFDLSRSPESNYKMFYSYLKAIYNVFRKYEFARLQKAFIKYINDSTKNISKEKLGKIKLIKKKLYTRSGMPYTVEDIRQEIKTPSSDYTKHIDIYSIQHHLGIKNNRRDVYALNIDFSQKFILNSHNYNYFLALCKMVYLPHLIQFLKMMPIYQNTTYNFTFKTKPLLEDRQTGQLYDMPIDILKPTEDARVLSVKVGYGGISAASDSFSQILSKKSVLEDFKKRFMLDLTEKRNRTVRTFLENYMKKLGAAYEVSGIVLKLNYEKKTKDSNLSELNQLRRKKATKKVGRKKATKKVRRKVSSRKKTTKKVTRRLR